MKKLLVVFMLLLWTSSSYAQDCLDGQGNIYNQHMLINADLRSELNDGESFVAYADNKCVGRSTDAGPPATMIPLTIWQDDPLTSEIDGVMPGEMVTFFAEKNNGMLLPLVYSVPYTEDGIISAFDIAIDTTNAVQLATILADLSSIQIQMDAQFAADSVRISSQASQITTLTSTVSSQANSLVVSQQALAGMTNERDALQAFVDDLPDIASLQAQLDAANATIAELQSDNVVEDDIIKSIKGLLNSIDARMRNR